MLRGTGRDVTKPRRIVNEITPKSSTPGPSSPDDVLAVGDVVVDLGQQTAFLRGTPLPLRAKSFHVLAYLARHAGRVVGKQELHEAVWGEVAVTDDSLVQCLVEIRRALGADHEMVKTLRGRGYLFAPPPVAAPERLAESAPARAQRWPARPVRWGLAVTGLIVGAFLLVAWATSEREEVRSTDAVRVTPQSTLNPAAREALEQGNALLDSRSQVDLQRARLAFAHAVELDPGFARAHAALSNALTLLSVFGVEPPRQVLPEASRHARRAVELDPTYAFGWHALGHSQVQWDWDWSGAEVSYRRSLALDPTDTFPRFLLGLLLAGQGRPDEAVAAVDAALAIDPQSSIILGVKGIVSYFVRRPEDALDAFARARRADPNYATAPFWQALAYSDLAMHDEALEAALASRREMGNAPAWLVGYVHARAGRPTDAREVLRALEAHAQQHYVSAIELALLHTALGDTDAALDWLDRGFDEHSRWMEWLAVHPVFDPLRGHPRFQRLLRAMRLPELS